MGSGGNGGGVGGAGVPAGAQGDLFGGWDVTGQTEGNTGMTSAAFADAAFAGDITGAGMGPTGGGSAGPGASFGGGGDIADAPSFGGDAQGEGGWWGGLSKSQQAMAVFTGRSMASGMIPAAILGLAGLALSGAGTGDVSTMGGGPSGDPAKMQAHRDFTGATGMTAPKARQEQAPPAKTAPERARRATTKTLFTSPLGVPGDPSVKRKTLMAKGLREDLG